MQLPACWAERVVTRGRRYQGAALRGRGISKMGATGALPGCYQGTTWVLPGHYWSLPGRYERSFVFLLTLYLHEQVSGDSYKHHVVGL